MRKNKEQIVKELEENISEYKDEEKGFFSVDFPFGLKLDNDREVYVSISPTEELGGDNLYVFESYEALGTFKFLYHTQKRLNPLQIAELEFSQNCLAILFNEENDNLENMGEEFFFSTRRYRPYRFPVATTQPKDIRLLNEVVHKVNRLISFINFDPEIAGYFHQVINGRGIIPVFSINGSLMRVSKKIVDFKKQKIKPIYFKNELVAGKLRNKLHTGRYAIEIFFPTTALTDGTDRNGSRAFYYNNLFIKDLDGDYMDSFLIRHNYFSNPKAFIKDIAGIFQKLSVLPEEVLIRDDRTFNLLGNFLEEAGIKVNCVEDIPGIDKLLENYQSYEENDRESFSPTESDLKEEMILFIEEDPSDPFSPPRKHIFNKNRFQFGDKSVPFLDDSVFMGNGEIYNVRFIYVDVNDNFRMVEADNMIPLEHILYEVISSIYGADFTSPEEIRTALEEDYILDNRYFEGDSIDLILEDQKFSVCLNVLERLPGRNLNVLIYPPIESLE